MAQQNTYQKRRTYLVQKGFQIGFILRFCLLLLAGIFLSTGLIFLFTQGTLTSTFRDSRLVIDRTATIILPAIAYTNLITLALITIATIIVTLFVSHKIAGPMLRFEKELAAVASGDLSKKIVLRKKDQMTGIAESLNYTIKALREKILLLRDETQSLKDLAKHQDAPKEIVQGLKSILEKIDANFRL